VQADTKTDVKKAVKVVAPDHHTVETKVEHRTPWSTRRRRSRTRVTPERKKKGFSAASSTTTDPRRRGHHPGTV